VLGGVLAAVPVALAVGVPAISAFAVVLVVLVVYPLTRRRIGAMLDRLVLGDVRARTSVEAIERERQRVSREIHDQPLQQLATVIHRIAGRPGLEQEAAVLQDVSMQLRGVTVQLHPPTLTDLGLGPALEALAEDLGREASMPVRAIVHARPGSRAPGDVELAAYRIAQEALGNAIRHSAARRVTLDATVDAHRVSIEVTDDGVGLDGVAMGEALARGRMGLRSMAERAELVGGELRFEDARPGTRVRFRWPA
jgi:two-component system sensor histidine kinase UhpB